MNYIYAALLLHSAGKKIDEANLKKVVESTGEKADVAQIKALTTALEGVNIDEAIKTKTPVAEEKAEEKKEEKEEEKKEEEKKEEAAAGLSALFG